MRRCKVCHGEAPRWPALLTTRRQPDWRYYGWCSPCSFEYLNSKEMAAAYRNNVLLVIAMFVVLMCILLVNDQSPLAIAIPLALVGGIVFRNVMRKRAYVREKQGPAAIVVNRDDDVRESERHEREKDIE